VEFIVRAHGGSIDVKSQPGRGSTFSVAIPEAL
jgi:signal transduction histidine kinase